MPLSTISRKLVYFIIYYNLFCGFAIKNIGLDKSFLFIIDILYMIIFLCGHFRINKTSLKQPVFVLCFLFFILLIGVVGNDVSPLNFIWGLRNQYFSLAIFFASASLLSVYDINKIFKFFFYFQFLNLACALYQYFVLGYYADANNGAFTSGGGQDIFCGILIAYYLYEYMQHRCKAWHFLFILVSSLAIAAIEEEKFIFIEIVFIFAYFYLTSKKLGFKKIALAIVFIVVFGIGLNMLSQIGGTGSLEILTNKEAFMEYQENAYALPRVGSSAIIEKMFFTNNFQYFFGLGMGKCEDASTLSFINTDFYDKYGWLQYTWFTFQINFLQTGWLGILLFLMFFVYILFVNIQGKKKSPDNLKYYYDISIIITILCIMTIWYNATLRSYNTIIPFFVLSIGGIVNRHIALLNQIKRKI